MEVRCYPGGLKLLRGTLRPGTSAASARKARTRLAVDEESSVQSRIAGEMNCR